MGARQKTPDPKDTRHFLPGWTKDTTPFCHRGQKTPDNFATVDRRHQTILPPWTEDTIFPKFSKLDQVTILLYPRQTVFVGGYTVFTLSERPSDRVSVTFCFLNILKNHGWNFIKFCKPIYMYKANTTNRKLRARGLYYWSYFPL